MDYKANSMELPNVKYLKNSNFFDNIKVDISKSNNEIDKFLLSKEKKKNYKKNFLLNKLNFYFDVFLKKSNLLDFLIFNGFRKFWFDEFNDYWINCLGGRPITVREFFFLHFNYRISYQTNTRWNWKNSKIHVANWQNSNLISSLFRNILNDVSNPNTAVHFRKYIKKETRVLEYGCGIAPAYRTYRRYFTDLNIKFTLLDIPNITFHFAKWSYYEDSEIERFLSLQAKDFSEPLKSISYNFDAVILHNVFEHLDHPRKIIEYLTKRLNKNGIIFFDYIFSEAEGLDSEGGAKERISTLKFIKDNYEILEGDFFISDKSLGKVVAKKI